MPDSLSTLKNLCKKWGGSLVEVSQTDYDKLNASSETHSEAPFTSGRLGVNYSEKRVVYSGKLDVGELIHEMGHVFASKVEPAKCPEFDFFGWEYLVAKKVGALAEWFRSSKDYCVDNQNTEFGGLSSHQQEAVLVERVAHAKNLGLVGPKGAPKSIR